MTLQTIVETLGLTVQTGAEFLDREVCGGYVSDMLSDVLAHASKGDVWITVQLHLNIIPIASMKEVAGIIIVNDRHPDEETLNKALAEKIPVLGTGMSAYQIVGKLYQMGITEQNADLSR